MWAWLANLWKNAAQAAGAAGKVLPAAVAAGKAALPALESAVAAGPRKGLIQGLINFSGSGGPIQAPQLAPMAEASGPTTTGLPANLSRNDLLSALREQQNPTQPGLMKQLYESKAETSPWRGLTGPQVAESIGLGIMKGGRVSAIPGAILESAGEIRGTKALAPFQEALARELGDPNLTPTRRTDLLAMQANTEIAQRGIYDPSPTTRPVLDKLFRYSEGAGPGKRRDRVMVGQEPAPIGSPEWQALEPYEPRARAGSTAGTASEQQRRRLAEAVRAQIRSSDSKTRPAIVERYLGDRDGLFGKATSIEGRAYMEFYPDEAAALQAGRDPYGASGTPVDNKFRERMKSLGFGGELPPERWRRLEELYGQ